MIKNLIFSFIAIAMLLGCAKNREREEVRIDNKYNDRYKPTWIRPNEDGTRSIWLSKLTVVNTSNAPAGTLFVGFQGDVQAGYFDFTEHHLQFRSVEGTLGGEESQNIKNNVLMNWNIRHVDYALDEVDGQTTNQEIESDFKIWSEKRFFEFQWNEIKEIANSNQMFPTSSFAFFSCWSPVNIRRVEDSMKIEDDHIGWDIEVVYQRQPACANSQQWAEGIFNFTTTFKYSFRKMQASDYVPKVYDNEQDPDRYKYGHFQTVRTVLHPDDGRPHNIFMENRWAEKTHYFYFVKGFPEKYKWIWDHTKPESVMGQTNLALAHMGSKLRFEIYDHNYNHETGENDPNINREFGDLRYSFINFIEELEAGGTPLGYGPSDTNPFTGEIIAANSMVWTGMLDFYLTLVEDVVKEANKKNPDGSIQLSTLFANMNRSLQVQSGDTETAADLVQDWDHAQGVGELFKEMAQETRFTIPFWNNYTMDQTGQLVVPMLLDRHNDGTVDLSEEAMGQVVEHASFFSEVIEMPQTQIPFRFETRIQGGQLQAKVIDPLRVVDLRWLDRILDSAEGQTQANGLRQAAHVLDHLQSIMNHNYTGPSGFEHIQRQFAEDRMADIHSNMQGHCMIDIEDYAGGLAGYLLARPLDLTDEKVRRDIINTVLYRVSIHEFGHNLNLRHNFYGSVDKDNFRLGKDSKAVGNFPGSNGLKHFEIVQNGDDYEYVVVSEGREQLSSSVMDYIRLEDEIGSPWAWEDYDIAALRDSYEPNGFDDGGRLYLYCTDEHTATSAICNRHDLGTTPSQILMSQIRSYDERYLMRNTRNGRAYWNTSGYASSMLGTMMSMKEFVPFWRSGLSEDFVLNKLAEMGVSNLNDQSALLEELNREMRNVMKLSMAFYDGVIQQGRAERDFRSEYDGTTGALKKLGIVADKMFATLFLAGDDAIYFNPNRIRYHDSYLTYSGEPGLARFSDQIWVNFVTDRQVAMDPWFINFTRTLYARNATNFSNRGSSSLINALKLVKVDNASDLMNEYGIEMEKSVPTKVVRLTKATSGNFNVGDEVMVVHINGDYYMTSIAEGKYAYVLFTNAADIVSGNGSDQDSITQFNMDMRELLWLYDLASSGALQ
jgi:hypothetical protein